MKFLVSNFETAADFFNWNVGLKNRSVKLDYTLSPLNA